MPGSDHILTENFIQYTGANGAEVAAFAGGSVASDNGSVLAVDREFDFDFTLNAGDWCSLNGIPWSAANFSARYLPAAGIAMVDDLVTGTMDGVSVAVPLLLLGASVDRVVTWNRPFADANYKVSFLPDAGTLGRITPVVKSGTKTASGLTVTISAGLAVTVAGALHVIGTT
jgi:hypothetical protein